MTVVVDASVVAEVLLGTERGLKAIDVLGTAVLVAPQHLTAEVASVIRGWSLGGHITDAEALRALREFEQMGVEQVDMIGLLPEVWSLRHNISAYDAMYVVLARTLDCRLLTLDARLAAAAPDCAAVPNQVG